mgnify:CR=1 FL=1
MQNIGRQSIMRLLQITMSRRRVITVRPHSRLGNIPPAAYAKFCAPGMQRDGALEQPGGSAPRPVAPPSPTGSNAERVLLTPG